MAAHASSHNVGLNPPKGNPGKAKTSNKKLAGMNGGPGLQGAMVGAGLKSTSRPRVKVKGSNASRKSLTARKGGEGPFTGKKTQGKPVGRTGSAPSVSRGGGKRPGLHPIQGAGNVGRDR